MDPTRYHASPINRRSPPGKLLEYWNLWNNLEDATGAFLTLASRSSVMELNNIMPVLERFTVFWYDKTSDVDTLNEARKRLYCNKRRTVDALPPTSDTPSLHAKRVAYVAGYIWASMLNRDQILPSPAEWGWEPSQSTGWTPVWTTLASAFTAFRHLMRQCTCDPEHGCGARCGYTAVVLDVVIRMWC